jgi:DNA invertase Pin-like site-specific DNA recombinase
MSNEETVVGYVRVSTDEQGANGAGLDAQKTAIRSECERRGWKMLRIEADVLSARTMRRPGLQPCRFHTQSDKATRLRGDRVAISGLAAVVLRTSSWRRLSDV